MFAYVYKVGSGQSQGTNHCDHVAQSKTVTTCLNEIRDRWRSHQQEEASYDLGDHTNSESITYVVEKPVDGHDQHLVGVRQVREMSVLIQQLKQELGASTAKDILPRTQRYDLFSHINLLRD